MTSHDIPKTIAVEYTTTGNPIYRKVKPFGNGAHIVVPKELIGETVFVVEFEK